MDGNKDTSMEQKTFNSRLLTTLNYFLMYQHRGSAPYSMTRLRMINNVHVLGSGGLDGPFSLAAGVGHPGGEQQAVDGGLSDEQQERPVGHEHLAVQVEGATDGHDGGGRRRLAALLVHLRPQHNIQGPRADPGSGSPGLTPGQGPRADPLSISD